MHFRHPLIVFTTLLFISACWKKSTPPPPPEPVTPVINFIGVSAGTLQTNLDDLNFKYKFEQDEGDILGVVSFKEVEDGSTVQATWFSPDDRRMPLGRTHITTASGAKIARFSLAAPGTWEKAPYMFKVRAWTGEGDAQKTATGSVHFFMGMNDEEIVTYIDDYTAWQDEQARKREEAEKKAEAEAASGAVLTETGTELVPPESEESDSKNN